MARFQARPERARRLLLALLCAASLAVVLALHEHGRLLRQIASTQEDIATALAGRRPAAAAAAGGVRRAGAAVLGGGERQRRQNQQSQQPLQKEYKPIPEIWDREELALVLQEEGLTTGAELGVLIGHFAEQMLSNWTRSEKYYLVDLWAQQENYKDTANLGDDATQEQRYQETKKRLERFSNKTEFLRMYTTEAAKKVPDQSLDFCYLDARHDYCGVMEDLEAWWPKMRSGGIFAGHDYLEANHGLVVGTGQDWSVCQNGTIHQGAVKGAVNDFAEAHSLNITVTGSGGWATWMVRVP